MKKQTEEVPAPLRKLQLVELDIFKTVIEVLDKMQIKYYITDGTLLGAVRHEGFIPWDDDIDISMPRKDYEQFVNNAAMYLPPHLKLINFKQEPNCIDYMTKVVNENYRLIHKHPKKTRIISVWIDIFPLDGMPDNKISRKIHGLRLLTLRALFKYSLFDELVNINNKKRPWYENILVAIGTKINFEKLMDYHKRLRALDRALTKYDFYNSEYVINFMGAYKLNSIMPRAVFGNGRLYKFEDVNTVGPDNYDEYLKKIYHDYMKLPPIDERNWHGNEIINN